MARYVWFVLALLRFVSLLVFTCETWKNSQPVRAKDPFVFRERERYDKVKKW